MPLFAYTFNYKGSHLGGVIVVVAENLFDATLAARKELLGGPYAKESLKPSERAPVPIDEKVATVVFDWDGDY